MRIPKELQTHFAQVQKGMELGEIVGNAQETGQEIAVRKSVKAPTPIVYNSYGI